MLPVLNAYHAAPVLKRHDLDAIDNFLLLPLLLLQRFARRQLTR